MKPRILFVDDEFNVLAGMSRQFRRHVEVELARSGAEALDRLKVPGRYAVIVSDLRMPGVDGLQLLRQAAAVAPHVVRVLLTGNLELSSAITAINDAGVFRILLKPCEPARLRKALDDAVERHIAELAGTEGLQQTNTGIVTLLTQLLGLLNPPALERAQRLAGHAREIISSLSLQNPDTLELAILLSQIGCVTLDPHVLPKAASGQSLSPEEAEALAGQGQAGARLLAHIPRLAPVAAIVAGEQTPDPVDDVHDVVSTGRQLLRVVSAYESLLAAGRASGEIIRRLELDPVSFPLRMVAALAVPPSRPTWELWLINATELQPGMVFEDDVLARDGSLLASRGQEASSPLIARVHDFARRVGLPQTIRVRVPEDFAQKTAQVQ